MTTTQGRRLPDLRENRLHDLEPGAYWRILDRETGEPVIHQADGKLTEHCWFVITPNGLLGQLRLHTVREHEDGTITVAPGDGSSNSILLQGYSPITRERDVSWHGYIDHGVWWDC